MKEVWYDVVFDEERKSYVGVCCMGKFGFDNDIGLIEGLRDGYGVGNGDMRGLVENGEYRRVKEIKRGMRDRGYRVERDEWGK